MNERRITQHSLDKQDPKSRLKAIAGQITSLPYKDMMELGRLLNQEHSSADPAGGLLKLAERILSE